MHTQMTLDLGIEERVDVRSLIVHGDIEREAPKAKRKQPAPEFERVLADGADGAFRRRCGNRSQMLVLLVTQGQYYVTDERTGSRHELTTARLGSFCKGTTGDALTPPWSRQPLQAYDSKGRAAVVALLNSGDFREMCKRDMVRVEAWAASRMGANARWNLSGTWEQVSLVWKLVEPTMGHNHCREALSAVLRLTSLYGEGRDEAAAECFRDRLYVSRFVESMGRDVTCDLLRGYLDKSAEHPRGGTADFLPVSRAPCTPWSGAASPTTPAEPASTPSPCPPSAAARVPTTCSCGPTPSTCSSVLEAASRTGTPQTPTRCSPNLSASARCAAMRRATRPSPAGQRGLTATASSPTATSSAPPPPCARFSRRPTRSTAAWRPASTSTRKARPTSGSCGGSATPTPRS